MSAALSSEAEWSSLLEPARSPDDPLRRADDPRLGEVVEFWRGDLAALRPGRAVLLGFPQDDGVRRNQGRPGACEAPTEIRRWLYRLTPWDGPSGGDVTVLPPLDLGNLRISGSLEATQEALAQVIGPILGSGAVPIVLGGGHETAFGHFLGYLQVEKPVGILNLDAHLDVRPLIDGRGHSGSPFLQALEHSSKGLPGAHYVCLGAQPQSTARAHWSYATERGCVLHWADEVRQCLRATMSVEIARLAAVQCHVYVTIDADCVRSADVPGVSAPNPLGLSGEEVISCARLAGQSPQVTSLDLVEINPRFDRDGESARWAALAIWNFLVGLSLRRPQ